MTTKSKPPGAPGVPELPSVDDTPELVAISIGGFGEFRIGVKHVRGLAYMIDPTDGLHMEIIVQTENGETRRFVAPVTIVAREFKDRVIAVPKTGADALVAVRN